jgi:galactokinase
LADRGLDPIELPAKTALYESILSTFSETFPSAPERILWIPGRLEVFGTHTDYAGGRTLIGAVPRGFAFAARARGGKEIRIVDARAGDRVTIPQSVNAADLSGWRRYCGVVVERLARNFPGASLGADVVFASDLPRASGMSSSSAMIVGLASTLVRLAGLHERPEWKAAIAGPLEEAAYYACLESGMVFGALDGDAGVGTHGGSEDHVAMLCAQPQTLLSYAFVPARQEDAVRMPDEWRFVVLSSGVASEKGGGAQASYNALASSASALLDLWNRAERPASSLGAALSTEPSAPDRLRQIVRKSSEAAWAPEVLERRLAHFVNETARIPEAVRAFRDRDRAALEILSRDSQRDAESLLRNHVPQTAALPNLAHECGAFASRSFGAGFGGSVWALVDRGKTSDFARSWLSAYSRLYPAAGPTAVAFVATPGPSLTELLP